MKRFTLIAAVLCLSTVSVALAEVNSQKQIPGLVALKEAQADLDKQSKVQTRMAAEAKSNMARSNAEIQGSIERINDEQQQFRAQLQRTKPQAPQAAPVAVSQQPQSSQPMKKGPMGNKDWQLDKMEAFYGKSMDALSKIGTETYTYDDDGSLIRKETIATNIDNILGVDPRIVPENAMVRIVEITEKDINEYSQAYLDSKTMKWVEVDVSRYVWQGNNIVSALQMHVDTTGAQIIQNKTESEFDSQNRPLVTTAYRRVRYEDTVTHQPFYKLDPTQRMEYSYGDDGMTTNIVSYYQDDSLQWAYSSKLVSGTDSEGFYNEERYYYSNGMWRPSQKSASKEVGPDANGITTHYYKSWYYDSSAEKWVFSRQDVTISKEYNTLENQTWYYSNNLQALYLAERQGGVYQGDTLYIGSWRLNYQEPASATELANQEPYSGQKEEQITDDETGRTKMQARYIYRTGNWIPSTKDEYEYTYIVDSTSYYGGEYSSGWQVSSQKSSQWIVADSTWKESSKQVYEYDSYGSNVLYNFYSEGVLQNSRISQYKYFKDDQGRWVKKQTLLEEYSYSSYENKMIGNYKYEYDYDDNGYQVMSASYGWNDGSWRGYYKNESFVDDLGRDTLSIYYSWDTEASKWYGNSKTIQHYDEEGETILYGQYSGYYVDGNTIWTGTNYTATLRNQNGDIIEKVTYYDWNTDYNTWWTGNRQTWTYNQHLATDYASYTWDYASQGWTGVNREAYTYNSQEKVTNYTIYTWGEEANNWIPVQKIDYTHTESGEEKDEYQFMWNEESSDWVPISKIESTVEDGKITNYVKSSYFAEMIPAEWRVYEKGEYTFDATTSTTTLTVSVPDYMGESWIPQTKKVSKTDAQGAVILSEEYSWNPYDSAWVGNSKSEYVIDYETNYIMETLYYWNDGLWVGDSKEEEAYDQYGNQTLMASYTWDYSSNDWRGDNKDVYSYDSLGHTTYSASYYWDYSKNDWRGSGRYEYTYDPQGNETGNSSYYWNDEKSDWEGSRKSYSESNDTLSISENYEWDEVNWCWKGNYKSERHYDSNGNTLYYAYYYGWEDGNWIGDRMGVYRYDKYDRQVFTEEYTWSSEHKDWRGSYKNETIFEDIKDSWTTTMRASYDWDDEDWCWIGDRKEEYEYDAEGKRIMTVQYEWDKPSSNWYGTTKYSTQTTFSSNLYRSVETNWIWDAAVQDWKLDTRDTQEEHYMANGLTSYALNMSEKYHNNTWIVSGILKRIYTYSSTAGIETVENATWKVMAGEGQIMVEGENEQTAIRIHSLSGQQVATARGRIDINVPAGIYLVTVDGETLKVSVR